MPVYEPYERLVPITVLGHRLEVPENNVLLRGFQYLASESVAQGRFCWNNECGHCELTYRCEGSPEEHLVRGCQFLVQEGMEITAIGMYLRLALYPVLEPEPAPGSHWPVR